MAGSLSNYAEQEVLKWLAGVTTATPTNGTATGQVKATLLQTLPTTGGIDTGTGTTGTDNGVASTGFSSVTLAAASWGSVVADSSGNSTLTYTAEISFLRPANWTGTDTNVVGVGLYDNSNRLLAYTDFASAKSVIAGETLAISANTLKLSLN